MNNTIVGIILGILILGGVFLYMQNRQAEPKNDSVDVNITLPTDNSNDTQPK